MGIGIQINSTGQAIAELGRRNARVWTGGPAYRRSELDVLNDFIRDMGGIDKAIDALNRLATAQAEAFAEPAEFLDDVQAHPEDDGDRHNEDFYGVCPTCRR